MQACTEMVMPQGANNKDSIFPESEWSYKDRSSYCEFTYNVVPRPHWITTEFGARVGYYYLLNQIKFDIKKLNFNVIN